MSQAIQMVEGDFKIDKTGSPLFIEGVEKLKQDIICLLLTPLHPKEGYDVYHPQAGCDIAITIGDKMVGDKMNLRNSVMKALVYYQELQKRQVANQQLSTSEMLMLEKTSMLSGGVETFLSEIENVRVIDQQDTLLVRLKLKSRNLDEFIINKQVSYLVK